MPFNNSILSRNFDVNPLVHNGTGGTSPPSRPRGTGGHQSPTAATTNNSHPLKPRGARGRRKGAHRRNPHHAATDIADTTDHAGAMSNSDENSQGSKYSTGSTTTEQLRKNPHLLKKIAAMPVYMNLWFDDPGVEHEYLIKQFYATRWRYLAVSVALVLVLSAWFAFGATPVQDNPTIRILVAVSLAIGLVTTVGELAIVWTSARTLQQKITSHQYLRGQLLFLARAHEFISTVTFCFSMVYIIMIQRERVEFCEDWLRLHDDSTKDECPQLYMWTFFWIWIPIITGQPRFFISILVLLCTAVGMLATVYFHNVSKFNGVVLYGIMLSQLIAVGIFKFIVETQDRQFFSVELLLKKKLRQVKVYNDSLKKLVKQMTPQHLHSRLESSTIHVDVSSNAVAVTTMANSNDASPRDGVLGRMLPGPAAKQLTRYNHACERHAVQFGLHHIRTVGDVNYFVSNLFREDHSSTIQAICAAVRFATDTDMMDAATSQVEFRTGVATGSMTGLPVGTTCIRYDIFGGALTDSQALAQSCPVRKVCMHRLLMEELGDAVIPAEVDCNNISGLLNKSGQQSQDNSAKSGVADSSGGGGGGGSINPAFAIVSGVAPSANPQQRERNIDDGVDSAAVMELRSTSLEDLECISPTAAVPKEEDQKSSAVSARKGSTTQTVNSGGGGELFSQGSEGLSMAPPNLDVVTIASSDSATLAIGGAGGSDLLSEGENMTADNFQDATDLTTSSTCCGMIVSFTNKKTRKIASQFTRHALRHVFVLSNLFLAVQVLLCIVSFTEERHDTAVGEDNHAIFFFATFAMAFTVFSLLAILTVWRIKKHSGEHTAAQNRFFMLACLLALSGLNFARPSAIGRGNSTFIWSVSLTAVFIGAAVEDLIVFELACTLLFNGLGATIRPALLEAYVTQFPGTLVFLAIALLQNRLQVIIYVHFMKSKATLMEEEELLHIRETIQHSLVPRVVQEEVMIADLLGSGDIKSWSCDTCVVITLQFHQNTQIIRDLVPKPVELRSYAESVTRIVEDIVPVLSHRSLSIIKVFGGTMIIAGPLLAENTHHITTVDATEDAFELLLGLHYAQQEKLQQQQDISASGSNITTVSGTGGTTMLPAFPQPPRRSSVPSSSLDHSGTSNKLSLTGGGQASAGGTATLDSLSILPAAMGGPPGPLPPTRSTSSVATPVTVAHHGVNSNTANTTTSSSSRLSSPAQESVPPNRSQTNSTGCSHHHQSLAPPPFTAAVAAEQVFSILRLTEFPSYELMGPGVNMSRAMATACPAPMVVMAEKLVRLFRREYRDAPILDDIEISEGESWRLRHMGVLRICHLRFPSASSQAQQNTSATSPRRESSGHGTLRVLAPEQCDTDGWDQKLKTLNNEQQKASQQKQDQNDVDKCSTTKPKAAAAASPLPIVTVIHSDREDEGEEANEVHQNKTQRRQVGDDDHPANQTNGQNGEEVEPNAKREVFLSAGSSASTTPSMIVEELDKH